MRTAELLDIQSGTERLLSVMALATKRETIEGRTWYLKAYNWLSDLAESFDVEIERMACCVAALSPGNAWPRNQVDATQILEWASTQRGAEYWENAPTVGTYKINRNKALACLLLPTDPFDAIRGRKVTAFAQCLADPLGIGYGHDAVCIDRHAIRAYQGTWRQDNEHGSIAITSAMYDQVADGYRAGALACAILPMEFQATVWLVMKRLRGE